jgi:hypothetical protein
MSDDNEFCDAGYPEVYCEANVRSLNGQKSYLLLIYIELGLACGVALASDLFEILQSCPTAHKILACVVLLLLVLMIVVQVVKRRADYESEWFEGRAVAESLKTLTSRYMMKVHPFGDQEPGNASRATASPSSRLPTTVVGEGEPATPEGRFHTIANVLKTSSSLKLMGSTDITDRMGVVRKLEWGPRRDLYRVARLRNQIVWYGLRYKQNSGRAKKCTCFSFLAEGLATVIASGLLLYAFGVWSSKPAWWCNLVPCLTTVAASIIAIAQAKRFDELKESYGIAYRELVQIRRRVIRAKEPDAFIEGVMNGENAISREHTMWAAKSASPLLWRPRS